MGAVKKPFVPGDSKLEQETKTFNKRALIGSVIIHLFFFLLRLPKLEFEQQVKDNPKLEPIKIEMITPPSRPEIKRMDIQNKLETPVVEKVPPKKEEVKKIENGTDRVVKNSKELGDPNQKLVQKVQKGDPRSLNKTAYKPGTDLRKLPKNDVGTGSAKGKVQSKDGNTGGSGDTYNGGEMTNLTDSLIKSGRGLKRFNGGKNPNDGGAGSGTGGGLGDGNGGGSGDGHFTGTTNGTADRAKIATNVGSLTGAAKGKIDTTRGFDGLATKGTVSVAGVPVEKISVSTINPDEIRRLLREHIPQFRYCYQSELDMNKNPEGLQGRINFRFKIGAQGRVTSSDISSEEITSDKVRDCIKNVLQGIQFPAPNGGKTVEVYQPMNFYPKRI
jgi:outer membrane biosynthesis protein TonB